MYAFVCGNYRKVFHFKPKLWVYFYSSLYLRPRISTTHRILDKSSPFTLVWGGEYVVDKWKGCPCFRADIFPIY